LPPSGRRATIRAKRHTLLNGDSSWLIEIDGTRILLDPWLEGQAVLVHPALHVARLGAEAVDVGTLPPIDAVVISHPFPDHCNRGTLRRLPPDTPVYTPAVVRPFAKAIGGFRAVHLIPNATRGRGPATAGSVSLFWCRAAAPLDTTHNALIVRGNASGETAMYCPHGLLPDGPTLAAIERVLGGRLDALLCSFTHLDLPGYLGGVANLGTEAAAVMVERLRPRYVMPTHDGEKPDEGFIARVARITRCRDIGAAIAGRAPRTEAVVPVTGHPWTPAPAAAAVAS
jgi:L-ascorbate metabolism protein UlaG (beta-lactamase superfamily)